MVSWLGQSYLPMNHCLVRHGLFFKNSLPFTLPDLNCNVVKKREKMIPFVACVAEARVGRGRVSEPDQACVPDWVDILQTLQH